MQVTVEHKSNVEKRLTITIPSDQVENTYKKQVAAIAKNAAIKGFRKGKVPLSYVERHFGGEARKEALGQVIQESVEQAITDEKLHPIAAPAIEPKNIKPGEALEFVAIIEIMPIIEVVNFKQESIEKLNVSVTDEDVSRVINQLRKQYTKWQVVDRAAQKEDRLVIDFDVIFNGETLKDQKVVGHSLELGAGMMIPGFEDGLIGAKASDERHLTLAFPEDFGDKTKAGKPVEFEVTIKQVFEAEMPELNEAFVKQLGIKEGQVDDLKQQIMKTLSQERDRLVKEKLKSQVFQTLLEQNPLEVPQTLVKNEAKNIHDEMHPQHKGQAHHQHSAEENTAFEEIAKKRITLGILVAEFSKKAQIKADHEQVMQRVKEIASVYENPEEVETWLSSSERLSGIEAQVMEDQVLDKLLEGVSIIEKNISYAELKGIQV